MYSVPQPAGTTSPAALAREVRLLLLDVDGVLTDGTLFISGQGEEYKAFNSRDGHGIRMLQKSGVVVGIVSGRHSPAVEYRAAELGVQHLHQGCDDKLAIFEQLRGALGLGASQIAFVGDDVVDLPIMLRAGLAIAVHDAHELVRRHAHWVTASGGGKGAVREVCELIMHAQGTYAADAEHYL